MDFKQKKQEIKTAQAELEKAVLIKAETHINNNPLEGLKLIDEYVKETMAWIKRPFAQFLTEKYGLAENAYTFDDKLPNIEYFERGQAVRISDYLGAIEEAEPDDEGKIQIATIREKVEYETFYTKEETYNILLKFFVKNKASGFLNDW